MTIVSQLPAVIIPIRPTSLRDAQQLLVRAEKQADIVEIWLDQLRPFESVTAQEVVRLAKKPLIVNLKDAAEKGTFAGSPYERVTLLSAAAEAGAAYVDIPLTFPSTLIRAFKSVHKKTKLILSWHDFATMPDVKKLRTLAKKALSSGADVVKLVGTAHAVADTFPILTISKELADQKQVFLAMAMGEAGKLTRVITPLIGGLGMFAALDKKSATAPGQMTVAELKKWWRDFA